MQQALDRRTDPPPAATVLVVDDDPGIRDLVSDFLTRHGYLVETAADACEMEAALNRASIDLVVLDVMLPGEDGLAICRRLAAAPGPAIIMLSAMGEETDRIVGLELGADDYLAKPCNPASSWPGCGRCCAGARIRAPPRARPTPAAASPAGGWISSGASCARPAAWW
jgi:two-component system OmpR family response regulator